jgi:uncharacterized membrane protein/protein-disulfide isomerase
MAGCGAFCFAAKIARKDRTLVPHKEMTRFRRPLPWWRRALTGLSALGLALSGYLGWHYLAGGSVIGCGGGSPCDQVLNSRWSAVGGVLPVSGLAAGVYLAMLAASLSIGPATETPVRRLAWRAMLVLVGAAAGSAVWFIIVQKWIIGGFCLYCMATHITGLLLAALVIWRAPRQFDDDSNDVALVNPAPKVKTGAVIAAPVQAVSTVAPRRVIRPLPAIGLALVGLGLAGILAACQVVITPPAVYRGGESRVNLPALNPHAVPLLGSPDAHYVVALLFDYNCPHCQQLHFMLEEAIRRYGGKLAFALCPAPLNSECNPYVPRDVDEFADSCELAKIGLAVWVAKREAFPAFDRWMFSFESGDRWRPRSLDAARAKAVELVGQAKFDAALADPWIGRYMQTSIRIFGATGGHGVPKLVFGSRWVIPEPNDADDLVLILHDSLAVPRP